MQLTNQVALVTGSTTGIGAAIARRFLAEGAKVMLHGRAHEAEAAAPLLAEFGENTAFCPASLEEPQQCQELVAAVIKRWQRLDIIVNNAAAITRSNLETTDAATLDFTLAVNVRAPLLLAQAALPHFRKQGGGTILNIGSINCYCGEANQLAYSISKAGLLALTRNLADAHAPEKIRVNQINPGWVLTENEYALQVKAGQSADWPQHLPVTFAPSGGLIKPEEIAHYALAFVAPGGGPISGAVVELEQYPVIGRNPVKSG